jgi:hypothetical protein
MTHEINVDGFQVVFDYHFDGEEMVLDDYKCEEETTRQEEVSIDEAIDRWLAAATYREQRELAREYKFKGV